VFLCVRPVAGVIMSMTAKKKLTVLLPCIVQFIGTGTVAEASLITFEVSWAAGMTIPDENSKGTATRRRGHGFGGPNASPGRRAPQDGMPTALR
jgi:hypothetical protein